MGDWLPWAAQAAFYEAKRKGFYDEENIDVEIKSPPNPADPIRLVAGKRVQFSLTYVPEIMLARQNGIPVVSVGVVVQKIASGLMFLPESGVKTPADLKGKTLGVGAKADAQAFLRTMMEASNLKRGDVKIVDPGYAHTSMLMSGTIDAAHALEFGELLTVNARLKKEKRPPAVFLPYSAYGVPAFYYIVIAAHQDWVKTNPQTTCRFIRATVKGLRSALENPEPINTFITDAHPGTNTLEENREKWRVINQFWVGKDKRFFSQDLDTWSSAQKWGIESKLLEGPVETPDKYFTNSYLDDSRLAR
jgi:putative hydroxymethylpyrimidine transport system substrate-binding protein